MPEPTPEALAEAFWQQARKVQGWPKKGGPSKDVLLREVAKALLAAEARGRQAERDDLQRSVTALGKTATHLEEEREYNAQLAREAQAERDRLHEALESYGRHDNDCILSRCSQGRPTASGGYESRYKGVWYETRPVDKTPPCECGLDAALQPPAGG